MGKLTRLGRRHILQCYCMKEQSHPDIQVDIDQSEEGILQAIPVLPGEAIILFVDTPLPEPQERTILPEMLSSNSLTEPLPVNGLTIELMKTDFTEFYRRAGPIKHLLKSKFSLSPEDADDMFQDMMMKAIHSFEKYDPEKGKLVNWLISIGENTILDHFRRVKRRPQKKEGITDEALSVIYDEIPSTEPEPHEVTLFSMRNVKMDAALRKLQEVSPKSFEILQLSKAGKTQTEIANITGYPLGTVKSRYFRGLEKLREIIGDDKDFFLD
jgi:RNA polymerase sigma factor (sigma-70 family)